MCLFAHVAAGAIVGALSPNTYAVPFLALASHVALDVIPHRDIDRMRYELLLAALAVGAIAVGGALSLNVALGIAFAIVPDTENLLWKLGAIRDDQKIFPGHRIIFPHGMVTGRSSIALQMVFAVAAVAFLIRRSA